MKVAAKSVVPRLTPLSVGQIPDHWQVVPLKALASSIRNGFVGVSLDHQTDQSGVRYLQGFNIRPNRIDLTNETFVGPEFAKKHKKARLTAGDILTVQSGHIGTTAMVTPDLEGASCHALIITSLRKDSANPRYLVAYMNSTLGQARMRGLHVGSSIVHINTSELAEYRVPLPPREEQDQIADMLGAWEEALQKLDALISAKERRKQGLMQQLLTGKRRLPGFDKAAGNKLKYHYGTYPADWSRVTLGEVTQESTERLGDVQNGTVVLSCTKHRGLVSSEEYFGKRVYAADISTYKMVRRGQFAYATNHIEEGSIGHQNVCDIGAVSPIYTVFLSKGEVHNGFLFRLLKSSLLIHLYRANTSASVDRRGSLRYDEFSKIKINLPGKAEQEAIAAVLDAADLELTALRDQRAALDQQKRGLMQQLLTGKLRVKAA